VAVQLLQGNNSKMKCYHATWCYYTTL
jgi:hypothetical protein